MPPGSQVSSLQAGGGSITLQAEGGSRQMQATLGAVIPVDVRPLAADDLAHIQQALPPEHPEAHVRRLADQRAGRVTYLIAWFEGRAVGHVLVRWSGCT